MTTPAIGAFGPLIESRLKVLSWNLWWRFGPWEQRRPAIVAHLRRIDADVVALQEVWRDDTTNFAAVLGEELGFHHAYDDRRDIDGIGFGNGILSRWPILRTESVDLPPRADFDEGRTVLMAEVDGPRGPVQVFSTHLNWRLDDSGIRVAQVRTLAQFVADCRPRSYPPVIGGDFNAGPETDEIRMMTGSSELGIPNLAFTDAYALVHGPAGEIGDTDPDRGITWSNDNPYAALDLERARRLDYVFVGWPKQGGAGHPVSARVECVEPVDGVFPSDHYAMYAELRY